VRDVGAQPQLPNISSKAKASPLEFCSSSPLGFTIVVDLFHILAPKALVSIGNASAHSVRDDFAIKRLKSRPKMAGEGRPLRLLSIGKITLPSSLGLFKQ